MINQTSRNGDEPGWWLGMAIFLSGWGTIVYQLYSFLRDGEWVSVSIVKVLTKLPFDRVGDWALAPGSWTGLHRALDFLPYSAAAVVLGFLIMLSIHIT
ncbi:hypothetical protein [Shinella sp.]|uniref:hypothetical protein n=1 Tax=Shinella sp. TaxID=1870904 RepID=UPI004035C043